MLQPNLIRNLTECISDDRLRPYLSRNVQDPLAALGAYAWNIALCESLYPALNGIEVALRNSINNAAVREFNDEHWFRSRVRDREQETVSRTGRRLNRFGRPLSPGDFVADLSFGFWVSLFDSRYDGLLWPRLLSIVFPEMPRFQRSYKNISTRLERIRRLRNRVFHHEPIWHWRDLSQQHSDILETIGWISPEMMRFIEMLDRFPEVYSEGTRKYEQEIGSVFQNPLESQRR